MSIDWNKFCTLGLTLILVYFLANNFNNNSSTGVIGYDEAVYVINAMGHYEETPFEQPNGGWLDAVEKGMMRTGDPPGFFFILHFWEKFSMSEQWLRLLSFLFFCIGIFSLIKVSLLLGLPSTISVAMGYLPLASSQSVYHSIEIRAYAMELGLTSLAIYASLKLFKTVSSGKTIKKSTWLWFTFILLLGISSRWSFVVTALACYGGLFICAIYNSNGKVLNKNIYYLLLSGSTVCFIFALFYLMAFGAGFGLNLPFLTDPALITTKISEYLHSDESFLINILLLFRNLTSTLLVYPGVFYNEWTMIIVILYFISFLFIIYYLAEYFLSIVDLSNNTHKIIVASLTKLGWVIFFIPLLINPFTLFAIYSPATDLNFEKLTIFWLFDFSFIIIGFSLIKIKNKTYNSGVDSFLSSMKKSTTPYLSFCLIPILAFLLSMILAYFNFYPFAPRSRVSLYLQSHYNIFIIVLIGIIYFGINNSYNYLVNSLFIFEVQYLLQKWRSATHS